MESLILVTEATGFIQSYIIQQLQNAGHKVRGTVVSQEAEQDKVKLLLEMCPEAKYKLEIVEADPAKGDSWESAMSEVEYMIHAIKPQAAVPATAEGEAPVQPAVEAVTNLCKASVASKTVKRIVLTSSYQAICGAPTAAADKVFTEADWADAENADPLIKSLVLAEKAAWEFVKELTDADKIDLCVMNPSLPLGPPLIEPQADVVRMLLDGGVRGCPRVCYSLVDVRDVAEAHVKALTLDNVAGNRHILHGGNLWMKDIASTLSKELKPKGYSIPTLSVPSVALWGMSLFNKTAKTFLPVVGKQSQLDNTRMKDVLGVTPKDVKETVVEEAHALIEKGVIKKQPKKVKEPKASGGASAAAASAEGDKVEEVAEKKEEGAAETAATEEKTETKETEKEDKKEEGAEAKTEEAPAEATPAAEKAEETPAPAEEEKKEEASAATEEKKEEEKKDEN